MTGVISGQVLCLIGDCYKDKLGVYITTVKAAEYYRYAIKCNPLYAPPYIKLHGLLREDTKGDDKSLQVLLEAEEKGVKDEIILSTLVKLLCDSDSRLSKKALGKYKTKANMAREYCNILIRRRSPKGYQLLLQMCYMGLVEGPNGKRGEVRMTAAISEEADQQRLATFQTYYNGVAEFYM